MPPWFKNLLPAYWFAIIAALLSGCEFFKKKDQAPAYIQLEEITFSSQNVGGSASSKITDVWVSAGSQNIGTFGLPTKIIPILANGPTRIALQPGVMADGNPQARVTYPFYALLDTTLNLEPGKVTLLKFTTKYNLAFVNQPFLYYDDFEQPLLRTDTGRNSNAPLLVKPHPTPEPFLGASFNYASMELENGKKGVMELVSKANLPIPQNSSPVYLEFDIRTTLNTRVGVVAFSGSQQLYITDLVVRPTDTWKKFYCFLSEEVNIANANSTFKIVFRSDSDGSKRHQMDLDNIRLVTYSD
jgi:hypothetical protein